VRDLIARYGWKTVAGTLLFALGELLETRPGMADYAALAKAAGTVLGGVGIRAAIAKIGGCNGS
jgi:hypothetical protein